MTLRSAIWFMLGTAAFGMIGTIWDAQRNPNDSPELGWTMAVIGVALFSVLPGLCFYLSAFVFRLIRGEEEWTNAPILSIIIGAPFWFIIGPLHQFTTDRLLLPEGVWRIEMVAICAFASEAVRAGERRLRRAKKCTSP